MSMLEQLDSVDDGEPPSSSLDTITQQLFTQLDQHSDSVRYSEFVSATGNTRVALTEDDITARISGAAYQRYDELALDGRQQLEQHVIASMAEAAFWVAGVKDADVRAIFNREPVFFEPLRHAMLLGERDERRSQITVSSHEVITHEQRRILLGGLATFVWSLDNAIDDNFS